MIRRKFAYAALLAALVMPVGASGAVAAAPQVPDDTTVQAMLGGARELIERRTSALVEGSDAATLRAPFAPSFGRASAAVVAVEQSAAAELTTRRDLLRQLGEAYTSSESVLTIVAVQKGGNSVVLDVEERTRLTYAKIVGDEADYTEFVTPRRFTFARDASGWVLKSHGRSDTRGPAPMNEPTGASADAMVMAAAEFELARAEVVKASAGDSQSTTKAVDADAGAISAAAGYNYPAMAAYAEKYWDVYNPHYRTFNERGGDCTNFISQAMREGGWTFVNGFYRDDNYWWYQDLCCNQTWTWASVQYWYAFAALRSGRTTILAKPEYMGLADVLQADFTNDTSKDHTMIVSYRSSTMQYLTYHTTDTYRRTLANLKLSFPSARWIPHRT